MVCFHIIQPLQSLASRDRKEGNARNFCLSYSDSRAFYCRALLRESMVVSFYIKLFRTGVDRHNGILMFLLLLVAGTVILRCCLDRRHFTIKEKISQSNYNTLEQVYSVFVVQML